MDQSDVSAKPSVKRGLLRDCFQRTHRTFQEAAAEGMVLLKNEHNLLPLKAGSRIALFGKGSFDYVKEAAAAAM